ncbi:hypothetical protein [Clostridium sp. VAP52]|uniref:hypothetical protein n=1 Tax=Clostridium sp. VAP52 TaxID=2949977 RepID=UPI0020792B4B|nr:hypothetical protein [Clostridium sp. VAP52]
MPQVITTQDSDSKGNIIHTETEASVVTYKDNDTVENNLNNLNDREELFVTDTNPTKKGFWINKSEQVRGNNSNTIVDRLKKYMDSKIGILSGLLTTKKENIVEAINEVYDKVELISNTNLLDNGDFQIWTNGTSFSENSVTTKTANKWSYASISSKKVEVLKSENGLKFNLINGSDRNTRFHQFIEKAKRLNGKTLTISFSAKSLDKFDRKLGILSSKSIDFTDIFYQNEINLTNESKIYRFTFTIPNNVLNEEDVLSISFGISTHIGNYHGLKDIYEAPSGEGIEFEWIKLELGDEATPFVSKSYEEEFNNCLPYRNVLSNPNLLINGDFQVWQRGEVFKATGMMYTSDRWRYQTNLSNTFDEVIKTKDGLKLKTTIKGIHHMVQILEDTSSVIGKMVILSANMKSTNFSSSYLQISFSKADGTSEGHDVKLTKNNEYQVIKTTPLFIPYDAKTIYITFGTVQSDNDDANVELDMEWVKLELGSVATPFVPRTYGEELALCQRYYRKFNFVSIPSNRIGDLLYTYLMDIEMRNPPTVHLYEGNKVKAWDGTKHTDVVCNVDNVTTNTIRLMTTKPKDDIYNYDFPLELSAEIF